MKTKKSLGTFIFLSVLGFLLVGCASFDIEKELSQLFTTQMPMYSTANPFIPPLYATAPSGYPPAVYNQPWWRSNPAYHLILIDSLPKYSLPKYTSPLSDPAIMQKLNDSLRNSLPNQLPTFQMPNDYLMKAIREQNPFKGSK
jgi:hypothetical protein